MSLSLSISSPRELLEGTESMISASQVTEFTAALLAFLFSVWMWECAERLARR
jgi:hypothetical protein